MTLDVRFVVPGPVVPWQRAASVGTRRFTSTKQRSYQRTVRTSQQSREAREQYEADARTRREEHLRQEAMSAMQGKAR